MKAALDWQVEMGADEAIAEAPIDRYALEAPVPKAAAPAVPGVVALQEVDAVGLATTAAEAAADLAGLEAAMAAFELCELKQGARQLVFADGRADARVMIIGEAPGRDEDLQGKPFVGRAGQLLDLMFRQIGMARDAQDAQSALYITNVLPWRPPQKRDPEPEEMSMILPILHRHIELVNPDILVAMGNDACEALLGRYVITRLRVALGEDVGKPVLPLFNPSYLLRSPMA